MYAPRRLLMYLGNQRLRSLEKETLFALMLVCTQSGTGNLQWIHQVTHANDRKCPTKSCEELS